MRPHKSWLFSAALAGLAGLVSVSCQHEKGAARRQPAGPTASAPATTRDSDPTQHWVQDQKLRTVMAELSLRTRDEWPKDVPDDPEVRGRPREETFRQAADLADGLAGAAARIPKSVEHLPLNEADRTAFTAEAGRLRDGANALKAAATRRRIEPMQRALDQINSSCIACHSQYRDFTGALGTQRASAD